MIRKYLLPILAAAGMVFAVLTAFSQNQPVPAAKPVSPPAFPPFRSYVGGAGIIETSTENIAVGTPVSGLVVEVLAKAGDLVKPGDPLFRLDDRSLRADLSVRKSARDSAKAKLKRLRGLPRPEDVPPAEARAKEAEAQRDDLKRQLEMWESLTDKRAVSEEALSQRRFALQAAEARLLEAKAQLDLLKAGAWQADIEIARADVKAASAQVKAAETELDRLTVRAPVDGQVLQVKIRAGEFAPGGVLPAPLMLLGRVSPLHVRVDVDENDAWRVHPGAAAVAFIRGNREIHTAVRFVRFEPYVVPKKSLTGDSAERVDTRVLQILYRFDRGDLPIYVGQQVDVFIEAPPVLASEAEPGGAK